MCFSVDKIKPLSFCFDTTQYSKESDIMKKRIDRLNKKIELSKKLLK